jgi:hypothetical protein
MRTFYRNTPAAVVTPATPTPAPSTPAAGNSLQTSSAPATQGTGTSKSGGGSSGSSAKTSGSASLTSIPVSTQTISGSVAIIYSVSTVPVAQQSVGASTQGTTHAHAKSSKAWIAGAIAGPIVVLLIIAALVFYILHLKRKGKSPPATPHPGYYQKPVEGHFEVSATPAPASAQPVFAAAQQNGYYEQPMNGYHEVSANAVPMTTTALPELAGGHHPTYNYNAAATTYNYTPPAETYVYDAANSGNNYVEYSEPQTFPVEMDAPRR